MEKSYYIIISLLVIFAMLFVISGYLSAPQSTGNSCSNSELSFNYSAQQTPVNAPTGTNTFSVVYVTDNGNVPENISISASASPSLSLVFAKPFQAEIDQKSYTEYEISNPTKAGNYSLEITLSAVYAGCKVSKSFTEEVEVTSNSSS